MIAILAAILFPVFARARGKARQASCLSNLKQIGLGIQMYTQDYDEMLPVWGQTAVGPYWVENVLPYIKNETMYICPSDRTGCVTSYNPIESSYSMAHGGFSYANVCSLAAIDRPSEKYLVGEAIAGNRPYLCGPNASWVSDRHDEGSKVVFIDGHARWLNIETLRGDTSPWYNWTD
jgi:prepilin-type processing-associated H-X9-DG protein